MAYHSALRLLSTIALVSSGMRHTVACACLGVEHVLTLIIPSIATLYGAYLTAPEAPSLTWFKCSYVNLIKCAIHYLWQECW